MQSQTAEFDWYRYALNLNTVLDPGRESFYCSASPNLLGGVLANAPSRSEPRRPMRQQYFGVESIPWRNGRRTWRCGRNLILATWGVVCH
jgi:hypothetical protein